jgi:hypothetical protein
MKLEMEEIWLELVITWLYFFQYVSWKCRTLLLYGRADVGTGELDWESRPDVWRFGGWVEKTGVDDGAWKPFDDDDWGFMYWVGLGKIGVLE